VAAIAALSFIPAACSDDGQIGDTSQPPLATVPIAVTATTGVAPTIASAPAPLDFNRDGQVVFGIATTGPADDGAYSQAIVDAAQQLSAESGFAEPVVVDNIHPTEAAATLGNLAQQPVDIIILGSREIAEPLADLIAAYPDIYWYCNCGSGIAASPGIAQTTDNRAEISYTAGYATALLLEASGGRTVTIIGCCDLAFERLSYTAFEAALREVDRSFRMVYVRTGDADYDFDNIANATAAFRTALDEGTDAVYPYLSGAHRAVVQAANQSNTIVMSAGTSSACDNEELAYDIAVRFDGGDYLRAVIESIADGTLLEGTTRLFRVGIDPEPGAIICNPTPEQQAAMDAIYSRISAGELNEFFAELSTEALAVEV